MIVGGRNQLLNKILPLQEFIFPQFQAKKKHPSSKKGKVVFVKSKEDLAFLKKLSESGDLKKVIIEKHFSGPNC